MSPYDTSNAMPIRDRQGIQAQFDGLRDKLVGM